MNRVAFGAVAMVLIISSHANAQTRDPNNVGCGLGSIIWEGSEGVPPQVFAATTNGTFGTQTFGITSHTSGCAKSGKVMNPEKVAMFISPNIDRLAQDMSRGDGETLTSLADVIGITPMDRPAFYAATQKNFRRIMPSENVTAGDMANSLFSVMGEDPLLKQYAVS